MLDVAVVAEAEVTEAAAVAGAQVAADPVVVELVVVGAGAEADAACPRRRGREQFVAGGGVQRDVLLCTFTFMLKQYGSCRFGRIRCWLLAGARIRVQRRCPRGRRPENSPWPTLMPPDSVPALLWMRLLAILQIMAPGVHEDAAAALRAVGDCQAIDARRIAPEVARERVDVDAYRAVPCPQSVVLLVSSVVPVGNVVGPLPIVGFAAMECSRPCQHRNARSFVGAHQRGLLQQLGQVAVERGIPADDAFERQAVDLRVVWTVATARSPVQARHRALIAPVGSNGFAPMLTRRCR